MATIYDNPVCEVCHCEYKPRGRRNNLCDFCDRIFYLARIHKNRATALGLIDSFSGLQFFKLCKKHNFRCMICGDKLSISNLTPDHIHPLARGGSNSIDNIQPTCCTCNYKKAARDRAIPKGEPVPFIVYDPD